MSYKCEYCGQSNISKDEARKNMGHCPYCYRNSLVVE